MCLLRCLGLLFCELHSKPTVIRTQFAYFSFLGGHSLICLLFALSEIISLPGGVPCVDPRRFTGQKEIRKERTRGGLFPHLTAAT